MLEFGLARQLMQIGDMEATFFEHTALVFADALGGFDAPATGKDAKTGAWVLFMIFMFITNLIALNTLIAILGDKFEEVMAEKHLYDMREKIVLLTELNDFYYFNKDKKDMIYIHIIRYVS
jgi:HJR/Mrr/RecB family endonuclease